MAVHRDCVFIQQTRQSSGYNVSNGKMIRGVIRDTETSLALMGTDRQGLWCPSDHYWGNGIPDQSGKSIPLILLIVMNVRSRADLTSLRFNHTNLLRGLARPRPGRAGTLRGQLPAAGQGYCHEQAFPPEPSQLKSPFTSP